MLLDSVILIDLLNGVEAAFQLLKGEGPSAGITAITRAEVLAGYDEPPEAVVMLLERLRWFELSPSVADLAAQLRTTHGWKLPDAFQAATAVHYGSPLATRNTRDFPPEAHDFVVVPYTL